MFVREGKFKWMAPKKYMKDKVQGGNEKQYKIKREREILRERLLLESVKTIMQTDTLEIRCRLPWQQALG